MCKIVFMAYLLILAYWDLKEKKIPVWWLIIGIIAGCANVIFLNLDDPGIWIRALLGMLPGFFLLLVSFLTGKVGYADGVILLVIGLFENYKTSLFTLCLGLFLASLVSVLLLVLKKVKGQTTIPFVPFLTAAFCVKEVLL